MLREENDINADKEEPEMRASKPFIIHDAKHLTEPIVETCKYTEDSAHRQNIMEMGHDIISIMQISIHARIGEHHTCYAAHNEEEDKGNRPLHRDCVADRPAPHCRKP